MRALRRNQSTVWFSHRQSDIPQRDENGLLTLDYIPQFSEPEPLECTVIPIKTGGKYRPERFGERAETEASLYYTGKRCHVRPGDILWIGVSTKQMSNFRAVRVTDALTACKIGARGC